MRVDEWIATFEVADGVLPLPLTGRLVPLGDTPIS
jgi:hypothetical protein